MDVKLQVLNIIRDHNYEIIEEGDWWYGLSDHDINVFQDEQWGDFTISIYKRGKNGDFDYTQWENLPSLTHSQMLHL